MYTDSFILCWAASRKKKKKERKREHFSNKINYFLQSELLGKNHVHLSSQRRGVTGCHLKCFNCGAYIFKQYSGEHVRR